MRGIGKFVAAMGLCFGLGLVNCAFAQDFPSKPIRFIVPTAPGAGGPDLTARLVAPAMSKMLGQPIVVENRTGASGTIAYEHVARQSVPDGHAVLMGNPPLSTIHLFVKDLRFSPQKDLVPAALLMEGALLVGSSAAAPWKDFHEMVRYAKANPGKVNFGTSGVQTAAALIVEAMKEKHGIDVVSVPFKGGLNEYRPALMTNTVQLAMYTESAAYADAGKVRIIATTGDKRLAAFPDTPTHAELRQPEIPGSWYALFVPAGTPRAVIDKLSAAAGYALQQPEVKEQMAKSGLYPLPSSPAAAEKRYADDIRVFTELAAKAGIKPQ